MDLNSIISQFEDIDDANFKNHTLTLSLQIQDGKITILDLIENLNNLLTNDHVSKRELGTSVLTEVLKNMSSDNLNQSQLEVMSEFYNSKLKDHHQILPTALSGILTLIQCKHFPGQKVPTLLNSIFKNVACQQQQRKDRYTIYQIFDFSLKIFKEELLEMKLEFVYMVLSSVDGERDPRNLLFLFKWMKVFLSTFSLHHLTEDMFDVLACYFPIDFRAPQSETAITREALAEALTPCLCAVPEFGDSCLSLALEKLDSSLEIAKIDSLKLLKEGCSTFPTSIYLEKAPEIWSLIQKEIFTTNSEEIKLQCLTTLFYFISKITVDPTGLDIVQNIFDNLKGNLLPDSKLFEKSSLILLSVGQSPGACKYIIKEVIPILTNIYNMTAYSDQKSLVVKTLVEFVKVHLKHNKHLIAEEVPELLKIPIMCLDILNFGDDCRTIGFDCLEALVPYLTPEIKSKLYLTLQSSIFVQDSPNVRESFLKCLHTATIHNPTEVKMQIFNNTMSQPTAVDSLLNSMIVLVDILEFQEFAIDYYIEAIKNEGLFKIAIKNTRYLLERHKKNTVLLKVLVKRQLLDTLFEFIFVNNCKDIDNLKDVSIISRLLISAQTSDLQSEMLQKYFENIFNKINLCDFYLIVMDGLVSALKKDVNVDYKLLDICYNCSVESQSGEVRNVASMLLANLINKADDDQNLNQFLMKLHEKCTTNVHIFPEYTIITSSWIIKGLLMRNHRLGLVWLDWLLCLVKSNKDVPKALRTIMKDDFDTLSIDVHCNQVSLYKQKTFLYVTKKIFENYDSNKLEYLVALGYVIEYTPIHAVLLHFSKLPRFIILSLEKIQESQVLAVMLTVVNTVCSNNSALIETHLEDYLTRILKLTTFESSMNVRLKALRCLILFTSVFPLYKLLPFKSTVLYHLGVVVDDKKRLVRREAMHARCLWFLLDAPL